MKIILTESQYEKLFNELPTFLKRRITLEDLQYFDEEVKRVTRFTLLSKKFEDYLNMVIGDIIHEFVMEEKHDEIKTEMDPVYGSVFNQDSLIQVMNIYWDIIPILKKRYRDYLYDVWKTKMSMK
jgi:hypothetical protein